MKKYISTFVLILVVLLLIIGLGYSFKLLIKKDKEIATLNQKIQDLNGTVDNLKGDIEKIKGDTDNTEKENTDIVLFDESKIINKPQNVKVFEKIYDSNGLISLNVKNNSIEISLDSEIARQLFGYNGTSDLHTITGFNSNIVDAKIVSTGKSAEGIKIVILMSDKTVKYIDIESILDKSYAIRTISNAQDIVRIVEVCLESESDSKLDVLGIKSDGTSVLLEWNK